MDTTSHPSKTPSCPHTPVSRRAFSLRAPRRDCVSEDLIAEGLSRFPMYEGDIEQSYSLAQHALEVARRSPSRYRMAALIYFAPAAYMRDPNSPRKLDDQRTEERVRRAIYRHFGLPGDLDAEAIAAIRGAEAKVTAAELRDLLGVRGDSPQQSEPDDWVIEPLDASQAKNSFTNYIRLLRISQQIEQE